MEIQEKGQEDGNRLGVEFGADPCEVADWVAPIFCELLLLRAALRHSNREWGNIISR